MPRLHLQTFEEEFQKTKSLADRSFSQLSDNKLHFQLNPSKTPSPASSNRWPATLHPTQRRSLQKNKTPDPNTTEPPSHQKSLSLPCRETNYQLLFTNYPRPLTPPPHPPATHPPPPLHHSPACTAAVAPSADPISEIIFCTFELAVPVNSPFARGSSSSDSVTPANAALLKNAAIELAPEFANDPSRIYAAESAPLPAPAAPPSTDSADEDAPEAPVPKYPLKIPDAADEDALITFHLASRHLSDLPTPHSFLAP